MNIYIPLLTEIINDSLKRGISPDELELAKVIHLLKKAAIFVIIFWNFAVFQYRSDSSQVKRNLLSGITNLIYELSHDLPNDLRLKDLR